MATIEVTLPKWGMTMQEGTIAAWLKTAGDSVQAVALTPAATASWTGPATMMKTGPAMAVPALRMPM